MQLTGAHRESMSHHDAETKEADEPAARTCSERVCVEPLSAADARAIGTQLRKKRATAAKQSITRRVPLRTASACKEAAGGSSRRHTELLAALDAAKRLPVRSAYARHRRACLEKALQLLDCERCAAVAACAWCLL